MKKTALLAVVILFLISISNSSLYSQTKSKTRENSLKEGSWALMFGIDQNFRLTTLNGFTLSIKKHTNDAHAFRLGLSVSYENQDASGDNRADTAQNLYTTNGYNYSVALYPSYYIYIEPKADVNFYIGLGLYGKYERQKSDYVQTYNYRNSNYEDRYDRVEAFEYGINTNLGVEFFPIRSFSIFAEYSLAFGYSKNQSNEDIYSYRAEGIIHGNNSNVSKKFSLNNQGVAFGLCVYF
ncbi:MAG: hypothetical protein J0M18_07485 [Ignavibacteria bacterium]|nr:hypothetical protein [Ignavibacteria bacterium]